ncbi:amino acid ABC transporter ATP-binding protein [Candidatus Phytoplasma fraxini]|uniref:Amino acid ABC transporter ATP-binding protein n=1 Tax=Ash yellows phytoplasma TaxID=35780 RepID=A0ABZ2U8E5_ASHYP
MEKYIIRMQNVQKHFNNKLVLKNINLQIKNKEILVVIGYSGSGKSTLLRCLNLLERPDQGKIFINQQNILEPNFNVFQLRTKIGMIFQSFNLFEEKNVLENCCLSPIKILKIPRNQAQQTAISKLKEVGLEDFLYKDVKQLSGGQKQRVAIARALCMEPEILLLDEPTSALDPESVQNIFEILQKLTQKKKMTLIIATHEMAFAKKIAHNICFMEDGKIIEKGTSKDIFKTNKYPKSKNFFE